MNKRYSIKALLKLIFNKVHHSFILTVIIPMLGFLADCFSLFKVDVSAMPPFSFFYSNGELRPAIRFIFMTSIIIAAFVIVIRFLGEKWVLTSEIIQAKLYKEIVSTEKSIHNAVGLMLKEVFIDNTNYRGALSGKYPSKESRAHPKRHIQAILDESIKLFSDMFGCVPEKISICLIEKTNGSWSVLAQKNPEFTNTSLDELVNNPHSTFFHTLSSDERKTFFNNKKEAYNNKHYFPNPEEQNKWNDGVVGSIFCSDLSILDQNNNRIKECLFAVSTVDVQFCNKDRFSSNLCEDMFKHIGSLIQLELYKIYEIEQLTFH